MIKYRNEIAIFNSLKIPVQDLRILMSRGYILHIDIKLYQHISDNLEKHTLIAQRTCQMSIEW